MTEACVVTYTYKYEYKMYDDNIIFSVALYAEPQGNMLFMFQGQQGGVTHLKFSSDGTKLYSGGRKVSR